MNSPQSNVEADSAQFERLCELGRQAAQDIDAGRYFIGDLALEVQKAYRRDTIGRFAKEIGVAKARVQEYRTVCKFWEKSQREHIFETYQGMVSYTHLRQAMRLKNNLEAFLFIEECGNNGWTCEQATVEMTQRLGKPTPPPKLLEGLAYVVDIRGQFVTLRVDTTLTTAMWDAKSKQLPVTVVIRPSEEHPDFGVMKDAAYIGSGHSRRIDTSERIPA